MSAGQPVTPDVVVAVLTYRRAELLPDLLSAALPQIAAAGAVLLVVDNDPEASARPVVATWAGVRYVHEPRPGISAARNRALDDAAGADVLVFLDDDELPSPGWLDSLLATWREWACAAVAGPVPPLFSGPVDPWVAGSGVFDRPERATGLLLHGAGAGNLLLDLDRVRRHGLRFDESLGLTGGEDTLFTHHLVALGEQIRWCAEAEAVELVPAERLTRRWARQRSFRSASSLSRAELTLARGRTARLRLRLAVATKAAARTAQGAVGFTVAVARRDVAARGRAVCLIAAYAGLVAGALGYVRAEYARPAAAALEPEGAAA